MSCNGRFRIYKWDGENYTGIQEWKQSPSILSGPEQTNELGVMAKGNTFTLYINGNLVAEVKDGAYDEGKIGPMIGSANTENFTVLLEKISYWGLE